MTDHPLGTDQKLQQRASYQPQITVFLSWLLIVIGVVLRCRIFFACRSLQADEARLALNILDRSFAALFKPLAESYGAPVGFLIAEKTITLFFGIHEHSFRVLPLLEGILSLVFLFFISRKILPGRAVPIAIAFFSLSSSSILYTSVMKQYSGDVFWSLLLLWIAIVLKQRHPTTGLLLIWTLCGVVAILMSYPVIFILAGYGLALICFEWSEGNSSNAIKLAAVAGVWLAVFAMVYFLFSSHLSSDEFLLTVWRNGFLPRPFAPMKAAVWLLRAPFRVFRDSNIGLSPWWLSIIGFGFGCVWLFSKNRRILFLFLAPMFFALLAAVLQKYPYSGRMILFIEPTCMIMIAAGTEFIWECKFRGSSIFAFMIAIALILNPTQRAISAFLNPYDGEETRQLLDHILQNGKEGDSLYIYYGSTHAFEFYHRYYQKYALPGITLYQGISRSTDPTYYRQDLQRLKGKARVWIILSHTWSPEEGTSNPERGVNEEQLFRLIVDSMGACRERIRSGRASLWLYDLSS